MKKILFAVFALAALASCTNNEVIELNQQAIAFGDVFVDNGTRADYSQAGNPVGAFKVYGTVTGTANTVLIYNGNAVTRPSMEGENKYQDVAWLCASDPQYWVPNATYNFMAIVDGGESDVEAMPTTIDFTVADGVDNKDLLLATASVVVNNAGNKTGDLSTNDWVAFTFDHLLSKVMFTINSTVGTGYSIDVTSITVGKVAEKGVYNVAAGTWAQDGDTTTTLTFGRQDAYETRQILPVTQALEVTIAYDIYRGTTKISSATKTGTIPSQTYAKKTVYNVTATITATSEIKFTVNAVNDWTTGSGITL